MKIGDFLFVVLVLITMFFQLVIMLGQFRIYSDLDKLNLAVFGEVQDGESE